MRVIIASMLLALIAWLPSPAAAQTAGGAKSSPAAGVQNPFPMIRPVVDATNAPASRNIPPVSPQSRYRYQSGHWWFRNPTALPLTGQGHEREECEPRVYGQWSSHRLGPSAFSRYSLGYGPNRNPYSGYGYNGAFGRSLYGYGNEYRGLKPGYLGFGGNGYFSNGAFSSGD